MEIIKTSLYIFGTHWSRHHLCTPLTRMLFSISSSCSLFSFLFQLRTKLSKQTSMRYTFSGKAKSKNCILQEIKPVPISQIRSWVSFSAVVIRSWKEAIIILLTSTVTFYIILNPFSLCQQDPIFSKYTAWG